MQPARLSERCLGKTNMVELVGSNPKNVESFSCTAIAPSIKTPHSVYRKSHYTEEE